LGVGGGFTLTAPAPLAGKKSTLRIYAGGLLRAQGNLIAEVNGETTEVHVTSNASVVALRYSGGPLSVSYAPQEGTVCPQSFCVLPVVDSSTMMPVQVSTHAIYRCV
jgi:hypothetical protein